MTETTNVMTFILGIEKVSEHAIVPTRHALDLDHKVFCSENAVIPAHSTGIIKTGLAISSLPPGTHVRVIPNSGPVINKESGDELDVIVYNPDFENKMYMRGESIARVIVVADADVKMIEPEEWTASINDTTEFKRIITETQTIFYVASRASDRKLNDSSYIWNALVRLNKIISRSEYAADKRVCLAIGCRDLQGATAVVIDANIRANDKLECLRDLPLYYVDLETKKYVPAREILASFNSDYVF